MSDDECCSLKDLICGTRKLYIKNEKYLSVLRKLVYYYDKNIEDLYFTLIKGKNDKPELICRFIQNLKSMQTLMNLLEIKSNDHSSINGKCMKDINGNYTISSSTYNAFVKKNNLNNFSSIIGEIKNSDFVNKINFGTYTENGNTLGIYPTGIYFKSHNYNPITNFIYLSRDNSNNINSKKHVSSDEFLNLLNYKMPSYMLSSFHKEFIKEQKEKQIEFDDEIYKHKNYFNIDENDDKIVLRKIKRT